MKRPILAYGHRILKQKCADIERNYPQLDRLIADLWETMENANGCGLALPQIGLPVRLFIVNSKSTFRDLGEEDRKFYFPQDDKGIAETFINARIVQRSAELWEDEEGCLSVPGLYFKVLRNWEITIEYYNRDFEKQTRTFSGATARMIQHEYDHTEGVLYLDYLKPLAKRLIASKLQKIQKGRIVPAYPMTFIQ